MLQASETIVKEKLIQIFNDFEIDITEENYLESFDSVVFISLIVNIEDEFNISFPDELLNLGILSDFSILIQVILNLIGEGASANALN